MFGLLKRSERIHVSPPTGRLCLFIAAASLSVALPCQGDPLRIMPLGDSITHGGPVSGGYRTHLWDLLTNDGYTVDFLGSLSYGPSSLPDKDHEGHIGYFISQISSGLDGWMAGYSQVPDDILLMIGTNDMTSSNYSWVLPGATTRLGDLIDQLHNKVPTATIWVASIPPINNTTWNSRVLAYNAQIPNLVASKVAPGKDVRFVDIYSALGVSDLVSDGVHPNATGQYKIAEAWYAAGVPEPTTLGLLAFGGLTLLRRRRR